MLAGHFERGWFERLLQGNLMPHGQCLLWRPDLLLMHVGGDLLTVVAYFTIPIVLILLVESRTDLAFNWVFLMFSAFIFLCGLTHLINIINIWYGYYFIEGVAKVLTGIVSISTAGMLLAMLPKFISMPSRNDMARVNAQLQNAQDELLDLNARLERKVTERTIALEKLAITDELTGLANRRAVMRRLADEVQASQRYGKSLSVRFQCSIGVAQWSSGESIQELLVRVDNALYAAKEHGRNQVVSG